MRLGRIEKIVLLLVKELGGKAEMRQLSSVFDDNRKKAFYKAVDQLVKKKLLQKKEYRDWWGVHKVLSLTEEGRKIVANIERAIENWRLLISLLDEYRKFIIEVN